MRGGVDPGEEPLWLVLVVRPGRDLVDEDYTAAQRQVVESSEPKALATGVPELSFRVESVEPEFCGEMLLFTELKGRAGEPPDSAFVKLNVFPPGQRDWLVPRGWPHRVYLEVFPDCEPGPDGAPGTKTLNLRNPALAVHVLRGKADPGRTLLLGTESIEYEELHLSFPEIHVWGEHSIVQDPGAPLQSPGYGFGQASLIWKLAARAGKGAAT